MKLIGDKDYWIEQGFDETKHQWVLKELSKDVYEIKGYQSKIDEDLSVPEVIRKITKGAFWKRIGLANRAALIELAKQSSLVQAQLETIADSEYIDLDDEDLVLGLEGLKDQGVLSAEAVTKALADGVDSEVPEILRT